MTKSPSKKEPAKKPERTYYIVRSQDAYVTEFWETLFDTEKGAQDEVDLDGSDEFEYTIFKVVAVSEALEPPKKRTWRKL